jgi:hypothetical protein
MLSKELNNELNDISKKNLGQLLGTLEGLNASDAVIAITKTFFWKSADDSKMVFERFLSKQVSKEFFNG